MHKFSWKLHWGDIIQLLNIGIFKHFKKFLPKIWVCDISEYRFSDDAHEKQTAPLTLMLPDIFRYSVSSDKGTYNK